MNQITEQNGLCRIHSWATLREGDRLKVCCSVCGQELSAIKEVTLTSFRQAVETMTALADTLKDDEATLEAT